LAGRPEVYGHNFHVSHATYLISTTKKSVKYRSCLCATVSPPVAPLLRFSGGFHKEAHLGNVSSLLAAMVLFPYYKGRKELED
jgi:hypothetical protein